MVSPVRAPHIYSVGEMCSGLHAGPVFVPIRTVYRRLLAKVLACPRAVACKGRPYGETTMAKALNEVLPDCEPAHLMLIYRPSSRKSVPLSPSVRPCPLALADRDRRAQLEPRDLTAAFFGDPLPGMSALDRR